MSFDDIEAKFHVRYDPAALRQAIKDFREGKMTLQELQNVTKTFKENVRDEARAISTLRAAHRLQNFQLTETLRTVRSATSLFGSLNSVIQTGILKQIEGNQVSIAQREAFRGLLSTTDDLVRQLDILGPANVNVENAFKNLIRNADDLNSEQLEKLIKHLENLKNQGNLSAGELEFLNGQISILRDLVIETIDEEKKKQWDDFFALFAQIGLTASAFGTFVLKLEQMHGVLTKLKPILPTLGKVLGPVGAGLFIADLAGSQTAGDAHLPSGLDVLKTPAPSGGLDDFFARLGPPGNNIHINMEKVELNSDLDVFQWAERVAQSIARETGMKRR